MRPLIGLPADIADKNGVLDHSIGDKYVRAVDEAADCQPVVIPALGALIDVDALLGRLDGLVMTGALSNVHPSCYGVEQDADFEPYDEARDQTTLPLIAGALDRGMPLFCICRGYQELNVVLGGTLATEIQRLEGRLDHRAPAEGDYATKYGPRHAVAIVKDGVLHHLLGTDHIMVNSLHRQAIDTLAPALQVEAYAEDGTIEAVSVKNAQGFALGVQWHPEYDALNNPSSMKLFTHFKEAAMAYMARKSGVSKSALDWTPERYGQ